MQGCEKGLRLKLLVRSSHPCKAARTCIQPLAVAKAESAAGSPAVAVKCSVVEAVEPSPSIADSMDSDCTRPASSYCSHQQPRRSAHARSAAGAAWQLPGWQCSALLRRAPPEGKRPVVTQLLMQGAACGQSALSSAQRP